VKRSDALLGGTTLIAFGALGLALLSQHRYNMQPCPWCVLQRVIFVAIGIVALVGLIWRSRLGARVASALALGLVGCGIAAALWQHFVAASSASCDLTLADRIISGLKLDAWQPDVFMPMASCADAKVNLLGVPYEFWSLALFVVVGAAALAALLRPR
jgi:disulfide bond formation protein DsbB